MFNFVTDKSHFFPWNAFNSHGHEMVNICPLRLLKPEASAINCEQSQYDGRAHPCVTNTLYFYLIFYDSKISKNSKVTVPNSQPDTLFCEFC